MTEKQKSIDLFTAAALTGLLANQKVTDLVAAHDEGLRGDIAQAAIELGEATADAREEREKNG